jgi:hypothetical protein
MSEPLEVLSPFEVTVDLDDDLDAIAALDSGSAGAIASDGSGWIKKTYAQFKTALGLVKGDVGLGNVDNTADTAKPVSTAQQTALDGKASTSHSHTPTISPISSSSSITPDADALGQNGILRVATLTHSPVINIPSGGFDGQTIVLEMTASGATRSPNISAFTLTTGITSPVAIASGKMWTAGLRRSSTSWRVVASQVDS